MTPSNGTMGHFFKHLAVRLWVALFMGSLAALVVLPPLAATMGPEWMIAPGFFLLAAAYWISGLAFTALGRRRLDRLIGEAAVWERAGMDREARQSLAQAQAVVDSFFFSPFSRKVPAGQLLAQMARFQLSQTDPEAASDSIIGAYLHEFPRDREAAVKWLERMLSGRNIAQGADDIAAGIGAAHANDLVIQRMLAQFYLADRRCDFAALQAYRQLLDAGEPVADDLLSDIAELFLAQRRADGLALRAYVSAAERGNTDPLIANGIAACRRMAHPTPLSQNLIQKAEAILQGVNPSRRRDMASAFISNTAVDTPDASTHRQRFKLPSLGVLAHKIVAGLGGLAGAMTALGTRSLQGMRGIISARRTRTAVKWSAMGIFIVGVGWLVINTTMHLTDGFNREEQPAEPVSAPVTDPFTLQVAAYLKETDARRYVEELKGQGLDAYWTRATGNGKIWYQVRIAHFKTKAEAVLAGDDLKARHLIGDYYVANYKRPDIP